MNQAERRQFLIRALLDEQPRYRDMDVPAGTSEQKSLLRSLLNIRMPGKIGDGFLRVQDEYLQEETTRKAPSDAYVRSFLYLLDTSIKLYYTKALSDQALSLVPN